LQAKLATFTVTLGSVKVGEGVMVGVDVTVGVKVTVGLGVGVGVDVSVNVAVDVYVAVKVAVEGSVSVATAGVAVSGRVAAEVCAMPGKVQAQAKTRVRVIIRDLIFIKILVRATDR
jgi:hypothetical protein